MKLDAADLADLRPLIDSIIASTVERLRADDAKLPAGRIGFTEREAAALLGIQTYVLGDARRRGEIAARKVGKQYIYHRDALSRFISDGGTE